MGDEGELERLRRRRPSHAHPDDGSQSASEHSEYRTEYERDLDRIFYTPYFRRLAEVTQVSAGNVATSDRTDPPIPHTRMTHSLKVGQLGRRIAQYLMKDASSQEGLKASSGLDANVVEAAGRAHDLGHPPFGHLGEKELDEIARAYGLPDGFEGNAQTFRIISSLAYHNPGTPSENASAAPAGLDLTAAVHAACVKYPHARGSSGKEWKKYGFYTIDEARFKNLVTPLLKDDARPTLEAEIMDWADGITYAVHDVEDFFFARLIALERLAHVAHRGEGAERYSPVHVSEFNEFWGYVEHKFSSEGEPPSSEVEKKFCYFATWFPRRPYDKTIEMTALVSKLSSRLITEALAATHVAIDGTLEVTQPMKGTIDVFKELAWFFVIDHPDLAATQQGQRARLGSLTRRLIDWSCDVYKESETPSWPGSKPRVLTEDEIAFRTRVLPVQLRERVQALLAATPGTRSYEKREQNIVRGVIDYVASLRELEVDGLHRAIGSRMIQVIEVVQLDE